MDHFPGHFPAACRALARVVSVGRAAPMFGLRHVAVRFSYFA
jgi:hypothetical protein